ncbi:MAG TPA: DUF1844 domain-containing protein [Candidatus Krumholzibacteria bacterium]|nr:DUF1844 domain-containing protein [Candidatus Krumholzibacteria bacterium]
MKPDVSRDELLFLHLVSMLQFAAMQQMGKVPNPVSGEIERDLEHARASIDMVEMLHAKTSGQRTAAESEFIDKVLFELRMNFVDETKRVEKERAGTEGMAPDAPGAGGTDAGR